MRVGVYFGSFNPVHKGHMQIVYTLLGEGLVDQVRIIATGNYWYKQDLLPLEKRIRMLKLYANENIIIDETHNELEKTYMIFRALKEEYPDDQLYFVIGADSLIRFDEWVNYRELLQYPFIVIERNGLDTAGLLADLNQQNYRIVKEVSSVSSTYIRKHLDEDLHEMIDDRVLEIMKEENQSC